MLRSHRLSFRHATRSAAAVAALAAVLLPSLSAASEDTPARKYGRGLAGMTLGFMELPGNVVQETRTNGALSGMTIGVAVGLGKIVVRELTGVYEFVTAPFPFPENFEPLIQPEFPWEYFESNPGRIYGFSDQFLYEDQLNLGRIPGASVKRRAGAVVVSFPNDLMFEFNSAKLPDSAQKRLDEVIKTLKARPQAQVVVAGYTDNSGVPSYNRSLSRQRADAVRQYLVDGGIAKGRIEIAGYGDAEPVASNSTAAGRQANRRVEIELRASGVGAYR